MSSAWCGGGAYAGLLSNSTTPQLTTSGVLRFIGTDVHEETDSDEETDLVPRSILLERSEKILKDPALSSQTIGQVLLSTSELLSMIQCAPKMCEASN